MIDHVLYISKELLIKLFIDLPLILIGTIVVAIALIFKLNDTRISDNIEDQRLPNWAKWFDNGDIFDRKYGLNGDEGFRSSYPKDMSKWQIYRMRYTWLALRNPTNWFAYNVLGYTPVAPYFFYIEEHVSVPDGVEIGDWSNAGYRYSKIVDVFSNKELREYYWVHKWSATKCLRVRIGFKLNQNPLIVDRPQIQRCFVIQPYKSYSGA